MPFAIRNLTRSKIPRLAWARLAQEVLGRDFDLSLVICADKLSSELNRRRGRSQPTNVLSFKLSAASGEIFLNSEKIRKEARLFNKTSRRHGLDLYLHGLLHLAGFRHGRKMDQAVHKLKKRFGSKVV